MIQRVDVGKLPHLDDYSRVAQLTRAVAELRSEAATILPRLRGRRVWMINSTAQGGGVAEMLPRLVSFMNELGQKTQWAVITPRHPEFFNLTKEEQCAHGECVAALLFGSSAELIARRIWSDRYGSNVETRERTWNHDLRDTTSSAS